MFKITIITIGQERSSNILKLQSKYIKRLPWHISIHELKYKHTHNNISVTQHEESQLLLKHSMRCNTRIALDATGSQYTSQEFAILLGNFVKQNIKSITFLIGGAYGHSPELKKHSNIILSLSKMTFAHKLVRIILLEQLYRAYSILNNHPYHK